MKTMWCWRCETEMPMLDEGEYAIVRKLFSEGFRPTMEFLLKHGLPLTDCSIDERFRPVREAYQEITGMAECHQNAIMHHRIAQYGPPCGKCAKPLRTPQAKFCAACGATS